MKQNPISRSLIALFLLGVVWSCSKTDPAPAPTPCKIATFTDYYGTLYQFEYDAATSKVKKVDYDAGLSAILDYNKSVVSLLDKNAKVTGTISLVFNMMGYITKSSDDVFINTFDYDETGHLIKFRKITTNNSSLVYQFLYTWENDNMVSSKAYGSDGKLFISIVYEYFKDKVNNIGSMDNVGWRSNTFYLPNMLGKPSKNFVKLESSGTYNYTFDSRGNPSTINYTSSYGTFTSTYSYNCP